MVKGLATKKKERFFEALKKNHKKIPPKNVATKLEGEGGGRATKKRTFIFAASLRRCTPYLMQFSPFTFPPFSFSFPYLHCIIYFLVKTLRWVRNLVLYYHCKPCIQANKQICRFFSKYFNTDKLQYMCRPNYVCFNFTPKKQRKSLFYL